MIPIFDLTDKRCYNKPSLVIRLNKEGGNKQYEKGSINKAVIRETLLGNPK